MLKELIKRLLTSKDRLHYIGRRYTFITDGGWEVSGKVVEYVDDSILIESDGRIIKLKRSKIIGETATGDVISQPQPLVPAPLPRYDIREAATMPQPAVAKTKSAAAPTDLQERLGLVTKEAEELRGDLGLTETLADEKKAAKMREIRTIGSIIPEHMLLPEGEEEETYVEAEEVKSEEPISIGDLSANFGVDFRKDLRGEFDDER